MRCKVNHIYLILAPTPGKLRKHQPSLLPFLRVCIQPLHRVRQTTMLTKYLTSVSAAFSPFNARSGKIARNFLALLPPNARSTMAIDIKMLGQEGAKMPARLALKFSTYTPALYRAVHRLRDVG